MIVTTFGLTRLTLHTTDACHDGRIEWAAASVEPAWYRDVQHDQCDRRGDWNRPVRPNHVGPIRKHIAAIIREQQINPADQAQMALATNQGMPS